MKFVVTPAARRDILRQFLYWLDENAQDAAGRFLEAVDASILRLTQQPMIGTPKKLRNPRLEGLRRWPVAGFEVIGLYYLLAEDLLRIVRVLHGKRDVDRILGDQTEI